MHADVAAVIAELDAHRAKFEAFCRALTAEELARPVPSSTWLVRDFIAHLATIDEPVEEMFRGFQGAESAGRGPGFNIDTWNDSVVADRRTLGLDAIFAEAARRRVSLHAVMARFDDAALARDFRFGGDSKRAPSEIRVVGYLRGWCKHDPMHVADMLRALPGRDTPEVLAWLDDPVIRGYQAQMNRE